ncbi:retrotransposable element [Pimephales promelas]|nr:retrotransposable element [Pimephales promelas]
MDSANGNAFQSAVKHQGVLLGKHEEDISTARHAVETLAAQMSDLSCQVHNLRLQPPSSLGSHDSPEPRINNPPMYLGEATQCRSFLTQCEVIFSLQPLTYAKERTKVAYVISLLAGRAREWAAANWEAERDCVFSFALFKDEMIRVFDRSAHGEEASRLLSSLRQGRRSVSDFSIEFQTLATTCGWNQPALVARFLEGLNSELREEILIREVPARLDELIQLAIRVEKRFDLRRRARRMESVLGATPTAGSVIPSPSPDPEPMQLGGLRISTKERERRLVNRLCMYCAASDHFALSCPVKGQRSSVGGGLLASAISREIPSDSCTTLPVHLQWSSSSVSCSAMIDSGAEGNFVDEEWARQQGIPLTCLKHSTPLFALDGSSLPREEAGDLSGVPEEYHDLREVFSRSRATSLPPHRPYDCGIELLPGTTPPRGRLYSLSAPEREALENYLSDSLKAGTIVPSSSPAGAGFFFVKKKDGSLRPCIDYRGLNDITVKNRYPLPLMSSVFEILQGAKIFSKLDLRNAYHLVRIKEGDEWKTAFNTPLGHFEYRVLPFGLVNAPAVFQALVNDVLRDMLNVFVFVYLDDILIFSPSLQVHVQHVRRVLQRLLENRLFVKAEKCSFHVPSVTFLGSVISAEGISMDSSKVQAVVDWPVPDSRVALQRFLGFANFYRRFIRNFSQVAAPLTALTSVKSCFRWSESAQEAFDRLKVLFTTAPILIMPDITRQFIVEVDASEVGVGAVLSQRSASDNKVHPCAFFSHRLSSAERNYDVGNRELLAIRLALGEWRQWLEGSSVPFVVWTDHRNLEYIRSAKRLNARQARWSLFFTRFDFSISYRPGSKNVKPDALSRLFGSSSSSSTREEIIPPGRVVGAAIWGIERQVKRALSHAVTPRDCPRGSLFVPVPTRLAVLQWGHSSKLSAHPGVRGTIALIRQRFWWPTLVHDARRFIASCSVCAQTKAGNSPPAGLLRPLPVPTRPWSHIALDFITGLPASAGNTVILTVVDRFSKSAHFIPLAKLPSAKETAQIMVNHVFRLHGLPTDVVSDRGPQFSSQFWKEFCRLIGATVSLSSGFHPQTNGQAERANQIVARILRSLAFRNPASWAEQLPWAEYSHNSLPSAATGLSPFHCCLGYQPPLFPSQETESNCPSVQTFISRCKRTWRRVRSSLCRARRLRLSQVGSRFIGPFRIVKIINPVAVKLHLPPNLRRIHPVFHVSCVKPVNRSTSRTAFSAVRVEDSPVYTVRKILDMRRRGRGHQYLVDWEGVPPRERQVALFEEGTCVYYIDAEGGAPLFQDGGSIDAFVLMNCRIQDERRSYGVGTAWGKLCPLVPVWSNAALQGAVGSGTAHTPASVYGTDTLIPTARFTEQGKLA